MLMLKDYIWVNNFFKEKNNEILTTQKHCVHLIYFCIGKPKIYS